MGAMFGHVWYPALAESSAGPRRWVRRALVVYSEAGRVADLSMKVAGRNKN